MTTAGLVLAGGQSKRMGTDKALVKVDGVPMAARTAQALAAAGCAPVFLVGSQPGLSDLGLPVIPDPEGGQPHPLRGIAAGLAAVDSELVVVAACDLISLNAADVTILLAEGKRCAASTADGDFGLLAVLASSDADTAAQLAARGAPIRALLSPLPRVLMRAAALANANTLADLKSLTAPRAQVAAPTGADMPTQPQVLVLGSAAVPDALSEWDSATVTEDDVASKIEAATNAGRNVVLITPPSLAAAAAAAFQAEPDDGIEGGPAGLEVVEFGGPIPPPTQSADGPLPGWQRALAEMGGKLDRSKLPRLPDGLSRMAPVRQVLETAGERALVTTDSGETWTACGFPDLLRQRSKVVLIRDGDPRPEIVALHRHPVVVGIVTARDSDGYLPGSDWDPDPVAIDRTGKALKAWGELFAIESDAVFVTRGGRVFRWDGFHDKEVGTISQATASLVLRWSQR